MKAQVKLLERIYLMTLIILLLLIVFTPYLIGSGVSLFEEGIVEVATIIFLFAVGFIVLSLYRKEAAKNRRELDRIMQDKKSLGQQLDEAFRYIGRVNIQVREIKAVFSNINKFPETKKDFRYILQFLTDRILSMVAVKWVLIRIINAENLDTLREYCQARGKAVVLKHRISNKDLISSAKPEGLTVIASGQENFHIKTLCIMPKEAVTQDQHAFIKAAVNQLEMLFIIFTSLYYKNTRSASLDKIPEHTAGGIE